ncbi:hypothetical protein ABEB36_005346 [Hypothenemus hampei]|uniref:Uncharacterized protein n=1 Tax=Hypothenemus hampei TaxID=57062 RepID=A0ABD1EY25_HYPHA
MVFHIKYVLFFCYVCTIKQIISQSNARYNPTIIQDARLEPKVDGTFGFQYRTEDGISHAAQGDPNGFIQGTYSYKDPTGLKVNFNYFAGSRHNSNSAPQQQDQVSSRYNAPQPYQEPQEYRPRTRPPASYTSNQYQPSFDDRTQSSFNDIYNSNPQYRG